MEDEKVKTFKHFSNFYKKNPSGHTVNIDGDLEKNHMWRTNSGGVLLHIGWVNHTSDSAKVKLTSRALACEKLRRAQMKKAAET